MTLRHFISTLLLIICFVGFTPLNAQEQKIKEFQGIRLELDQHNQVFYRHKLKPKETLYGLSRYFKLPIEDLALVNNISPEEVLAIGTEIIIPISKNEIYTAATKKDKTWIPLLYKVDKQETLYKISNGFFPQKIENLISRNNINSFSIKEGRLLVIGWWSQKNKTMSIAEAMGKPNKKEAPSDIVVQQEPTPTSKNKSKKDIFDLMRSKLKNKNQPPTDNSLQEEEEEEEEKKSIEDIAKFQTEVISEETAEEDEYVSETNIIDELSIIDTSEVIEEVPPINYRSGIALWDKEGIDRTNLFVMHNEAKVDSYIRLKYDVTGQEVTAKVICAIPSGLYPPDTSIILSPAVALALGAKDSRFKIRMDYY